MSMIKVSHLTFCYEGSYDTIFEDVSFQIDSDWKLGFIGRNGKGKTTFLQLLMGRYAFRGTIEAKVPFQYFPVSVPAKLWHQTAEQLMAGEFPDYELWKVIRELAYLEMDADILFRPYETLSFGERTRVMLAFLFSDENRFLLMDEPTNHLDMWTREIVKKYLMRKSGFILVSHDRDFLNACVDHILSLNRASIEVCRGNFDTWQENKEKRDAFEISRNEHLKKDIRRLEKAAKQAAAWADKVEGTKIGYNPLKEDRGMDTRAYIGEQSRRMQQRRKNLERRQQKELDEKRALLKDVERVPELKLQALPYPKKLLVSAKELCIRYGTRTVCEAVSFDIERGDRVLLKGRNGCGKSSIIRAVLGALEPAGGELMVRKDLKISYVSQDTSGLSGSLYGYADNNRLDVTLFLTILRKLDFERVQFEKDMASFSEGQKKKVLLAASLCTKAHLYIWDEPLNFIDLFSRIQLERLICDSEPTMLFVEHDKNFGENVATKIVEL